MKEKKLKVPLSYLRMSSSARKLVEKEEVEEEEGEEKDYFNGE